MRRHRYFKHLPTPQSIQENRFLKPFARYLHHHYLWQFNRRTVAGGLAVGLFFGIISPIAQILLGAIGAIVCRVNLPVAAFATFVTNPLTVPPLYYAAYRLGGFLTGGDHAVAEGIAEVEAAKHLATHQTEVGQWFANLLQWVQTVGPQFALGLFVIAVASALAGYLLTSGAWQLQARYRWHRRRVRQG